MFKVSKQGLKVSALITVLMSVLDYFMGEEVGLFSIFIDFFVLLLVYEVVGFIESLVRSRFDE